MANGQFGYVDLAGPFQSGLQMAYAGQQNRRQQNQADRQNQESLLRQQQMQNEMERMGALPGAIQSARQGDMEPLYQLDPGQAQKYEKGQYDIKAAQSQATQNAAKMKAKKDIFTAKWGVSTAIRFRDTFSEKNTPEKQQAWQSIRQETEGKLENGEISPMAAEEILKYREAPPDKVLNKFIDGVQETMKNVTEKNLTQTQVRVFDWMSKKLGRTLLPREMLSVENDPKLFSLYSEGMGVIAKENAKDSASKAIINMPGGGMQATAPTRAKQEQAGIEADLKLDFVDELEEVVKEEGGLTESSDWNDFLGWMPKLGMKGLNTLQRAKGSFVPDQYKPWLSKMNRIYAIVKKFESAEMKEQIGGTRTADEIKSLAGSIISMDMGPSQMVEALGVMRREAIRVKRIANEVLGEGNYLSDMSPSERRQATQTIDQRSEMERRDEAMELEQSLRKKNPDIRPLQILDATKRAGLIYPEEYRKVLNSLGHQR